MTNEPVLLSDYLKKTQGVSPNSPAFLEVLLEIPRNLVIPFEVAHKILNLEFYEDEEGGCKW